VVGTVYTDMPLKPNVIEDLAREVSTMSHPCCVRVSGAAQPTCRHSRADGLGGRCRGRGGGGEWRLRRRLTRVGSLCRPKNYVPPPPARAKFCSENDEIMLEDESGRVRLIGPAIEEHAGKFVTGKRLAPLLREHLTGGS
jgi:hypothetical protein